MILPGGAPPLQQSVRKSALEAVPAALPTRSSPGAWWPHATPAVFYTAGFSWKELSGRCFELSRGVG